jgi:[protein-PII] uridylyltransferase
VVSRASTKTLDEGPQFVTPQDGRPLADEIRVYLNLHREAMAAQIRDPNSIEGESPGLQFSRAIDGLLSALYCAGTAQIGASDKARPVSMGAVGSYGRRSLSYQSDLDIRLLAEDEETAQALAEKLLYPLWDAGIAIGHQVVTVDKVLELSSADIPTATSLLDWRPLAGDDTMIRRLDDRAFDSLFGIGSVGRFLERLQERADERVDRYGGSVYLLEPDVRNGVGGLRDFDLVHWTARARWRVERPRELVTMGVLIPREWEPIERAGRFLMHVRNLLHLAAGRRNDRLSFERQEQVAESMGYGGDGPAVERFMSDYYRHARALTQARDMLFLRAAPPPARRPIETRIGGGLKIVNGKLTFAGAPDAEPVLAMRLYYEALKRNIGLHPTARAQVTRLTSSPSFCERLRESEEAARFFVKMVTWVARSPFAHGSVVAELHDVGLLTAMIPEFFPVVGRVHHDVYHVYTVDVHSIKALDRLRQLSRGELANESPMASHLAAEVARPTVLFFAALLHDIGKDIGGTSHCDRGAELVESILQRMHVSPNDIREIQHLVRKHLAMYHVATRRDIEDPLTVEEFCRDVHGHEGLRELFLLTVCDVGTTSPESLTNWKARVLDELYVAAESRLGRSEVDFVEAQQSACSEVLKHVESMDEVDRIERFLRAMPERYLLANEPKHIVLHAKLALEAEPTSAKVKVVSVDLPYAQFAFVADDRPGLLAMIAASIAAAHVEVVAAQVYSFVDVRGRARALDLFWVHAGERVRTGQTLSGKFEQNLLGFLEAGKTPRDLLSKLSSQGGRWFSRVTPAVATKVGVDNRGGTHATIIEVITRDRPGLLFELADAIQELGLVITLAKINTEGQLVADVFYVTEQNGSKVTDPLRLEALKVRIHRAIGSN